MKVLLLGTAAGGGFPQWNCACRMCSAGRDGLLTHRTQDGIAVSATGERWFLVNASPDIRAQLLAHQEFRPKPPRDTPVKGVLLTDAELDHSLGLMLLREGDNLQVWAPEAVLHGLTEDFGLRGTVEHYRRWDWHTVSPGVPVHPAGELTVTAFPVSGKRPRYAAASTMDGPWVVAYRITDPATGGTLVYAPCLREWPAGFDEFVADADCVIIDGTFHSAAEMSGATGKKADADQKSMGHIPIAGPGGGLDVLSRFPGKHRILTHLNNTNPVLDPASAEHAEVLTAGVSAPPDGTLFEL
ncbi:MULTISPECIES: pyrroloquinoline quinone biosynthesis protein PqqB [unclassified Crossiella]|uniref:pyrroloquinoline quinone biosynthesis protein PqqB n=1 Tax=unclassified Crossiella TaxID=2620835 RepID=UPI0020003DF2|nr:MULTISPECIES: pyrroloquinoline quinone biosynthesis protein PqqB [unclassified Crossiella]MCK2237070.1 pyrroloquinoline quinone biosynthesis protein PqqB [Crossiella sp. S99.2]MCK2250738.1 pyrroloquinoline quinone biosynthesis protein PqqB [Crossiella sp. S99.1]